MCSFTQYNKKLYVTKLLKNNHFSLSNSLFHVENQHQNINPKMLTFKILNQNA